MRGILFSNNFASSEPLQEYSGFWHLVYNMIHNVKTKQAYFWNLSWFQAYIFKLRKIINVCFILLPQTTILNKASCTRLCMKIALISHWTISHWTILQLFNFLGEVCFLQENYENMHKIQILTNLRASFIWHQGVCLLRSDNADTC